MARKIKNSFDTDYPIVGWDGGNEQGKAALIVDPRDDEESTEEKRYYRTSLEVNAVVELTKEQYDSALSRSLGDNANGLIRLTERFRDEDSNRIITDDGYFAVGSAALSYQMDMAERRTKAQKFFRYYYGVQAMLAIRNIFGKQTPDRLHIVAGHPPLNRSFKGAILDSLQGKWQIYFGEEQHKIDVKGCKVIDEVTGSALNHTLQIDGRKNGNAITTKGGETLVFDLGGGTVDVAILDPKGFPIAGTHRSAEIGILQAIREFKRLFDDEFTGVMGDSATGIPLNRVYEIFLDSEHKLRNVGGIQGGEIDCGWLFDRVINRELMNRLTTVVNDMVGNLSMAAARVIITGGAGDLLYNELATTIFRNYSENGVLHRSAEKGYGIYANAYGMAKFGQGLRLAERRMK